MTKPAPIDPATLSDQELVRALLDRYAPTVIPPCPVCLGPLSEVPKIRSPYRFFYCLIQEEIPGRKGTVRNKPGRGKISEEHAPGGHYARSEFIDKKSTPADPLVVELVNRFQAIPKPGRGGWC